MRYKEYKSVDEKWVKSIPAHWDMIRLKGIFQDRKERNNPIVTDFILSLTANQGVVPVAEKKDVGGNKPKEDLTLYNVAHVNDLLVNCMNVVAGSAGVSKWMGAISPVYYALFPRDENACNVWYYHRIFRLITFQRSLLGLGKGILMHESSTGKLNTVRMRISMDYLNNVLLPVPPRAEQDQIVRYLDWQLSKINGMIAAKKKQINLLQEHLRYSINRAVTHGINGEELVDSGVYWLGDIPKNWDTIKIKWLFDEDNTRNDEGVEELLTFSRKKGLIPFSEASDKEPSASDLTKYRVVRPGQLLENRMQAWSGMFICVTRDGCVSPDYSVFNPSAERYVNVKFYEYVFRNPLQIEQFANASRGVGSGFNRLYTPAFGAIYTVYPPQEEQDAIVEYLDGIQQRYEETIEKIEEEIECLHDMRNRLVSDVITGQIDVRNVEIPEYELIEETDDESDEEQESEETDEEQED